MKNPSLKLMLPAGVGCILAIITLYGIIISACNKINGSDSGKTGYYYANWTCNGQQQCIDVMGYAKGSDGPFCSLSSCQAWGNKYIPGAYNCSTTANTSPILGGNPPNGSCFNPPY